MRPAFAILDAHLDAQHGVQVGEGFVEEKDPRIADDGATDCDAITLAAGELLWKPTDERRRLQISAG
jgi:hypothetical protein